MYIFTLIMSILLSIATVAVMLEKTFPRYVRILCPFFLIFVWTVETIKILTWL